MMLSIVSAACGGLITLVAFSGFVLNISVMCILYRSGFVNPSHNSVYILAFCNIIGNTIQLFVSFAYLGPTTIVQEDYFEGGTNSTGTKFFSWIFLGCWYSDMFLQPVVALNRLVMVVFPLHSHIFNRRRIITYGVLTLLLGFVLSFFSDFVISCCIAYVYYPVYSYAYIDTGFNYVNIYIDLPLNSSSSFISILFYIIIFIHVRRNNLRVSRFTGKQLSSRKIKEIRYAVQFAFCSVFVLLAWVTFRVFPVVVPPDKVASFTVIAMCLILHCVANSLIFIFFNKEFKDKFFGRSSCTNSQNIPSAKESKILLMTNITSKGSPESAILIS